MLYTNGLGILFCYTPEEWTPLRSVLYMLYTRYFRSSPYFFLILRANLIRTLFDNIYVTNKY